MNIGRVIGAVVVGTIMLSVGWAFVQERGAPAQSASPIAAGGTAQARTPPVGAAAAGVAKVTNGGTSCGRVTLRKSHYFGAITDHYPYNLTALKTFEERSGQDPNIIPYFLPFGQPFDELAACETIHLGALPLIQVNPRHYSVASIAAGRYNSYLINYARAVRKFAHTIAFSFGHEMNGRWYPWGYGHVAPKTFIRAWRTIHRDFAKAGAHNVVWVWTVNQQGPGISSVREWWPGSAYVNWVGIDGHYLNEPNTFASVFGGTIATVRTLTQDPILIAETAVAPSQVQPAQIADLFKNAGSDPGIIGFDWFNIDARRHWHLGSDPAGLVEFRKAAAAYLKKT